MIKPPKSSAKIVWTYGPICGICFGMIYLAMSMAHVDLPGGLGEVVPFIRVAILGIPFFLVGMLASKQTGQVRTGMQTGLVTGLTVGIMVLASGMLVTRPSFTLSSVGPLVLILGVSALFGAVIGERGGLVGYRSQQQLQQDPPQQQ